MEMETIYRRERAGDLTVCSDDTVPVCCHSHSVIIDLLSVCPSPLLSSYYPLFSSLFLPSYVENVAQTSLSGFINFKPHQTLQGNQNSLQTLFLKR